MKNKSIIIVAFGAFLSNSFYANADSFGSKIEKHLDLRADGIEAIHPVKGKRINNRMNRKGKRIHARVDHRQHPSLR